MTQEFPGTEIDLGGAGDHVAKVDVKMRWIKYNCIGREYMSEGTVHRHTCGL